jgi:hypothetical protein
MKIDDYFNSRAISGYLFWAGNLTAVFTAVNNKPQLVVGALLTAASVLYPLTQKRPKLFAVIGSSLITAQGIIAATASGAGKIAQQIGTIPPMIQGLLMIRAARNSSAHAKPFKTDNIFLKPIELIDRYPILSGASIEGPGVALISYGAYTSDEIGLSFAAAQWTLANVFLAASDPALHKKKPEKTNSADHGPALF